MTRYFTFINDTSNKFWQITTAGTAYTVTFGRIGTAGQSQTKTVDSPDRCQQEADKLIREKTGKGYLESVDGVTVIASAPIVKKTTERQANPDQEALETILNRYDEIIQNTLTDQLLPFLQRVDKRHYPAVRKAIKQAKKHWCDTAILEPQEYNRVTDKYKVWDQMWGVRGTYPQKTIINLSALAILPVQDAKSFDIYWLMVSHEWATYTHSLLLWARPEWLTNFLVTTARQEPWRVLPYQRLQTLEQEGIIQYQAELFAMSIVQSANIDQPTTTTNSLWDWINFLTSNTLVVSREIPTLFDYPVMVQDTSVSVRKPDGNYERVPIWPPVFTRLLAEGKLDRLWFFEKCISVQTKDWNINLRAFYRKQVEASTPTSGELVSLQSALFPLLAAQHPHVVSWAISLLKTIAAEPDFRPAEMLDWVSAVLMRNDCKTALKTLLAMMERLLKTHPAHQTTITHLLADVFVINDLTLQTKAAALLAKYGDLADTDLQNRLQSYAGQMLGTVSDGLQTFLITEDGRPSAEISNSIVYRYAPPKPIQRLGPGQEVCLPETWNDFIFLIGRFISSDDPLDGEVLMNALLLLPADTPADFREQLKSYERQLHKMNTEGITKHCLRNYLLYWLAGENKARFDITYPPTVLTLRLQLYRLQHLDRKRKSGSKLPLLSLPTHGPYWISPRTLVERLLAYQQAGEDIESLDLAIAIARMPREETTDAITRCRELNEPLSSLMRYCLGESDQIILPSDRALNRLLSIFNQKSTTDDLTVLWAVAARTYNPDSIFTQFNKTPFAHVPNVAHAFIPDITIGTKWAEWTNYATNEIQRGSSYQALQANLPRLSKQHSALLYSLDLFERDKPVDYAYFSITSTDVLYWRGLIPQQPEALYTIILKYICPTPAESGNMSQALSLMLMPSFVIRQTSMLALACGLLARNKQISIVGAEVLIYRFRKQTIDATRLGDRLGWLLAGNYAPIQRLTDALNLVRDVSPLHNKALAMLLESLFAQLTPLPEPPKNTRKLLEIYLDLLVKLGEPPALSTTLALTNWQKTASLKKLCIDILKLS